MIKKMIKDLRRCDARGYATFKTLVPLVLQKWQKSKFMEKKGQKKFKTLLRHLSRKHVSYSVLFGHIAETLRHLCHYKTDICVLNGSVVTEYFKGN
jgi:hypothetical protein